MVSYTPRTWVAGETGTASLLNQEVRDPLTGLQAAWTAYTPTWTAATSNPTLGNGSLVGFWLQVGKLTFFRLKLTIGSTTNLGSGAYSWSLPATAAASFAGIGAFITKSGASTFSACGAMTDGTGANMQAVSASGRVSGTVPSAWATGDTLAISNGCYEGA